MTTAAGMAGDAPCGDAPWVRVEWSGGRATVQGASRAVVGGTWGPDGERLAEGTFAEWQWDGTRLAARTDRFGFQPLYYAARGGTLWLSPSIPALLAAGAPAELDDAALAVFLRLGYFLDADTAFRQVRQVPPAARIAWAEGQLTVEGGRSGAPRQHAIGRDEAVDRYVALFRAAMARRPVDPARTVVPLTGGRDSRHILLELHAAGAAPARTVTVQVAPPKSAEDVRVARALAAATGVEHAALPATATRHADEVEKNWRTGLTVFEHYWEMAVIRWLAAHGAPRPIVYDGIAGDTLSEAKYMSARRLELFRRGDLATYVAEELAPERYLPVFLGAAMYRRLARGLAVERLTAELRTHLEAPNPVGSYRFWNRTRRGVALAPFGLLSRVAELRAPFLDDALFDFLAGLPAELLVDRSFHTAAIARGYPAFAAIPYENPDATRPSAAAAGRRWTVELSRWLAATQGRRGPVRLLRVGAYAARTWPKLALGRRAGDVNGANELATYLRQLELLAGE